MFGYKIESLRTRMLLWVFCASVIPYIIGGAYIGQVVVEHTEAAYVRQAREVINNIQHNLDYAFLGPVENLVSTLAQDERITNINPDNLNNYTQFGSGDFSYRNDSLESTLSRYFTTVKHNHNNIGTVFLGSAWGGYMETPHFFPKNPYDPRLRSWYQETVKHRGQNITTDPYVTSVTDQMVISVTHTVERSNETVGVVGIMLYLAEFQKRVSHTKIGETGYLMVLNPNNKFVVSPKHPEWLLKTPEEINSEPLRGLEEKINTLVPYTTDDGDQVMLVNPFDKRGWKVVAVIDRAELTSQAMAIRNIIIGVYSITLLLVLLAITYATTRITRPLVLMTDVTTQMAHGNLEITEIAVTTQDELGQLAESFSIMAQSLKKSYTDLELRIEERRQVEEALREAHDHLEFKVEERTQEFIAANQELQVINEELIATLDQLKKTQDQLVKTQKMAALGGLVAGVAHEINTPAGVALTAASHLEEITKEILERYDSKSLKRRDFEDYIEESGQAVRAILSNLQRADQLIRSFKQVSVDQTSEARRVFNVKEYTEEILLSLSAKLKKTQHTVSVQCDEGIEFDSFPGGFSQILTNLLMNALNHGYRPGDAGHMVISIVKEDLELILKFSDDGKGMEAKVLEKIFDPFFTTQRNAGGSGLGLHIVYNIVTQQFKGTIECQSSINQGTIFTITFPLEMRDSESKV